MTQVTNLQAFDPFAEEAEETGVQPNYVHIRVQQRNGRKCLTTVQGLNQEFDFKRILKALKKEFCCNGTIVEDEDMGTVIQLQGDQRKPVCDFLLGEELVEKGKLKVHGF